MHECYIEKNYAFQVISLKDNDSLSARLAREINANLMILMTDVNGIYTGPPGDNGSRLIHTYSPADSAKVTFGGKSRVGLGGMESKVQCMEELGHNTWSHTNKLYFWQ